MQRQDTSRAAAFPGHTGGGSPLARRRSRRSERVDDAAPNRRRIVASVASVGLVCGLVAVSGCDDGSGEASTVTTATVEPSSYVSKPPATTTTTIDIADAEPGQRIEQGQEYTIQSGDYPLKIAEMYGVELEELMNYNEWADDSDFPYAGTTIRIPPGGVVPGGEPGDEAPPTTPLAGADFVTTTPSADPDGSSDVEGSATSTDASGSVTDTELGDNCGEGTYTIEAGDYPLGVAEKFDVEPQALDQANQATPSYGMFYPGLEIVIPAKSDC